MSSSYDVVMSGQGNSNSTYDQYWANKGYDMESVNTTLQTIQDQGDDAVQAEQEQIDEINQENAL